MLGPRSGAVRFCGACGATAEAHGKFCRMCGTALAARGGQGSLRRHVVVLFADAEGFTSMSQGLDPEVLRIIMDRYFRLAGKVIWGYGGTTEKFIGDAIMAVFGVPVLREDDALRAVLAATDLVAELDLLNMELGHEYSVELAVRVAVHSGPVSASYESGGDLRVVGDTVNTASRLQSAAAPKQVLVGETVAQAVRSRVELEPLAPLTLKGKEMPVRAWRVASTKPPDDTSHRAPLIGRDAELRQLRQTFERTVLHGRGAMATLLGPPGIGKSRLAEEFRASLSDQELTVLRGQATSYGQGVTYRPIVELWESCPRVWAAFASRAVTDPRATRARACLAALSKREDAPGPQAEVEEIAWALRTALASVAERRPLLLMWEDLHWAEPTLLDVIEYLDDELTDVPVMQVCLARPELLELRPAWSGGRTGALKLELAPLTFGETLGLVAELSRGGEVAAQQSLDEVRTQIASTCEGNPLFAELMLDIADDNGGQPVPYTIQALLAARLDQLGADDRLVLEMAAVAGRDFHMFDLEHLLAREARTDIDLSGSLDRLRRVRLLTGNRLSARHSFAQSLARDTAYEMTAKANRLRWHLALAERSTSAEVATEVPMVRSRDTDLVPYHLEAALRLTRELHPNSPSSRDLGTRAGAALTQQAIYATDRKDLRAAAGLYERALLALPADDPRREELTIHLSETWVGLDNRDRALAALGGVPPAGPTPVRVDIQREMVDLRYGLRTPEQITEAERRIEPRLDDDDLAWCHFHQLQAHRHLMREQAGAADERFAVALARARAAGAVHEQDRIMRAAGELALWGPTPVADGLERCRELAERFAERRVSLIPILATIGGLLALDGQLQQAREKLATASGYAADLRMRKADVGLAHLYGVVDSIAGEHMSAGDHFGRARAILLDAGNADGAALLDAYTARELVAAGQPVPPPYPAMTDEDIAARTDPRTGALTALLCARAAVAAAGADRVTNLVQRASTLAGQSDDLFFQGIVHHDIAVISMAAGRLDEALTAARIAGDRFRRKGARAVLPQTDDLVTRLCRPRREGGEDH